MTYELNEEIRKMKKIVVYIVNLVLILTLVSCAKEEMSQDGITVAVSIAPEESFVKAVAGDLVDVVTLIPSGASPTNYQPSPKEMTQFQNADLYFTIGVATEASNILPNIADNNSEINIIHLEEIVAESYAPRYFSEEDIHEEDAHDEDAHDEDAHDEDVHDEDAHNEEVHDEDHDHDHEGKDPHIWLSPKRVIVMVGEIQKQLMALDPENADIYEENAKAYIEELEALDTNLEETISKLENKTFIIMHPSLGYFADDYGLKMVALEQDGKESTASHLQEVIEFTKANNIKVVFYQTEFDSSQAETLASEINGEVLAIDVLSSDYMNNMDHILELFTDVLN